MIVELKKDARLENVKWIKVDAKKWDKVEVSKSTWKICKANYKHIFNCIDDEVSNAELIKENEELKEEIAKLKVTPKEIKSKTK